MTYNKILNQRNKLLKDIGYVCRRADLINTLDILDIQIARYGKEIIKKSINQVFPQLVLWTSDLFFAGAYADIRLSVRHAPAGGRTV